MLFILQYLIANDEISEKSSICNIYRFKHFPLRQMPLASLEYILHFHLFSGVFENTLMIRQVTTGQRKPKDPFPVTYLKFSNWPAKETRV